MLDGDGGTGFSAPGNERFTRGFHPHRIKAWRNFFCHGGSRCGFFDFWRFRYLGSFFNFGRLGCLGSFLNFGRLGRLGCFFNFGWLCNLWRFRCGCRLYLGHDSLSAKPFIPLHIG